VFSVQPYDEAKRAGSEGKLSESRLSEGKKGEEKERKQRNRRKEEIEERRKEVAS